MTKFSRVKTGFRKSAVRAKERLNRQIYGPVARKTRHRRECAEALLALRICVGCPHVPLRGEEEPLPSPIIVDPPLSQVVTPLRDDALPEFPHCPTIDVAH
jgi:hypothetical protein